MVLCARRVAARFAGVKYSGRLLAVRLACVNTAARRPSAFRLAGVNAATCVPENQNQKSNLSLAKRPKRFPERV